MSEGRAAPDDVRDGDFHTIQHLAGELAAADRIQRQCGAGCDTEGRSAQGPMTSAGGLAVVRRDRGDQAGQCCVDLC